MIQSFPLSHQAGLVNTLSTRSLRFFTSRMCWMKIELLSETMMIVALAAAVMAEADFEY